MSAIDWAALTPLRSLIEATSFAADGDPEPGEALSGVPDDTSAVVRKRTVLIVDDEAAIRSLVTTFLTRAGYDVDFAIDGQDAIEKLQARQYDALVTDLMMPRVDGVGVIRFLEREQPEMVSRTIVLTAYPRLAESEAVNGCCAIIAKPFELVNLRRVLSAMFEAATPVA